MINILGHHNLEQMVLEDTWSRIILLQAILLIRGPSRWPIRRSEGRGGRADDEGQRRTVDGERTEVFTPF